MASGEHHPKHSHKHRNSDEKISERHKHRHHHRHDRRWQKHEKGDENGETVEVAAKTAVVMEEGETERERNMIRGRERCGQKRRERGIDEENYRHNYLRHKKNDDDDGVGYRNNDQRLENKKYMDMSRKFYKQNIDTYEIDEDNDYKETVVMQLVEQEEEDVNRIKEESRRRRRAILEKYRTRHELKSEETESGEQPSVPIAQMVPPGNSTVGEGTPKSERSNDMFRDDYIFGDSPAGVGKQGKRDGLKIERGGLGDNWDDAEGYYSYRFGEVLNGRYEVIAAHGKGVFSNVVCAKDLKAGSSDPKQVAIKIIRSNDTMYKAGLEELVILKKLVGADQKDRKHCVRFLSSFKYRNHLCLVFESLHMNLCEFLKRFGRDNGLTLTDVRAYAKQLFIALRHLKNCGVLHSDIKPDNMLVNKDKNVLKLSDFGNAMFAGKNEITPYLVSRFYRAPEIILGLPYDHPIDIWSVGCCLYELFTGKVLFPGPSNNDMLRLHMELKGPFPKKMLRKGAFVDQYFDRYLNFLATKEDPITKKAIKRLILSIKPKDVGTIIPGSAGEDPKMLANFKNLLEKIFILDPDKRITVSQALKHPFIVESKEAHFLS